MRSQILCISAQSQCIQSNASRIKEIKYLINIHIAHRIQRPIPKLQICTFTNNFQQIEQYLVRDINSPTYFHQSMNIYFNEIWCYDYFNGAVKCILKPPQDLEKVG